MLYKNRIIKFQATENSFLFGVRGSGKTALLKQLFPSALYIDLLSEARYQSYLSNIGLFYEEVNAFRNDALVIVDEIQKMPQLLNEVHRFIESSNRRFILTASSARKIRAKGVNLLGGRAGIKRLYPFTPEELGEDFNLDKALRYGLLPIICSSPEQSYKLKNYVETYLKEEIKAEALVRNLPSFARFLEVAGLYHGQVMNMSAIAREAQISRRFVSDFFSILEDTMLGFFLPAYSPKLRLREQKGSKFYFIDPGLVRAIKGNFDSVSIEEKGFLFEGLVAQILRTYGDYNKLYDSIYYWSSLEAKQTEVDFLLKRGKELIAIEVKAKTQVSSQDYRGLRVIGKLPNIKKRIVVYMGESIRKTKEGVEIWPFDFFCKNLIENFESSSDYRDKKKPKLLPFTKEHLFLDYSKFKPSDCQIPPPENGEKFENLCLDLYKEEFGDKTQKHGTKGQSQDAVDIFVPDKDIGIQCKKRESQKIKESELREEVEKAKNFQPALKRFILASTCKRDVNIQKTARIISKEHEEQQLFSVEIHSWDEIKTLFDKYPKIYKNYYNFHIQVYKTPIPYIENKYNSQNIKNISIQSESHHQELNRIRDLINKKKPKTAIDLLERFKEENWDQLQSKEKYRVLTNMASARMQMRQEEKAAELLLKAWQFNQNDENANINCALAYLIIDDIKSSKKYIEKTRKLNPLNIMAYILEIKIKEKENQALEDIESAIPQNIRIKAQVALILSQTSMKRKQYTEAKKRLDIFYNAKEENESLKNLMDEAAYADMYLALILARQDVFLGSSVPDFLENEEIINIYKRLVTENQYSELKEFNPNWYLHYSLALELKSDLCNAISVLEEGIRYFPNDDSFKIELSRLYTKKGDINKSISILEDLPSLRSLLASSQTDISKKSLNLALILVDLYFQNKQSEKAQKLLDKIKQASSISKEDKLEVEQYCIFSLINLGKIDEAEEILTPLFEKDKDNIFTLILKSKIEGLKGKTIRISRGYFKEHRERKIQYLKKACDVFNEKEYHEEKQQYPYFESRERLKDIQYLSQELYYSEMYKELEPLLEEITNNNLNHPEIFKLLHTYFENGKNKLAIELAEDLLKKFPDRIESVNALFLIYKNLGNKKKAIQYYENFLKKNPQNDFIRIELILAYIHSEAVSKAKELLGGTFNLEQLSTEQTSCLSFSYMKTGATRKALEILYKCIKRNPKELEPQNAYFSLFAFSKHQNLHKAQSQDKASGAIKSVKSKADNSFLDSKKVAIDCYVQIKDIESLKETGIIIEEDADIYTSCHEFSKALLGKKKDEIILFNDKKYQILEIQSKYLHKWQEIAEENEKRYPSKSFVKSRSIPKEIDIKTLSQFFKKLAPNISKQHEVLDKVFELYNQGATIGSIAKISGRHSIEIIGDLIASKQDKWISAIPVWENDENTEELLDTKTNILIDLSSLITIHQLKIEKYIESNKFKIFICQSTIDSLTEFINKISLYSKDGYLTVGFDEEDELVKNFVPANIIKKDLNFWIKVKKWTENYCQIKPLSEKLVLSRKERQERENIFGKEFFDSLLAVDSNFILLSEDAFLRRLAELKYSVSGIRLLDLIKYFERQVIIDKKQAIEFKAQLVQLNQTYISIDHNILFYLLKEADYSMSGSFQRALYFLSPISHLQGVVNLIANFLIEICQASSLLLPYSKQMITKEVLDKASLERNENPKTIASQVFHLVQIRTKLLPILQNEIHGYIIEWLKGKIY